MRYKRPRRALIAMLAVLSIAGSSLALLPPSPASAVPAAAARPGGSPVHLPKGMKRLCAAPRPHYGACDAVVFTTKRRLAAPLATLMQPPYGADALQAAYNLTKAAANMGSGQTVAIVDAYDYPNLENDLATYRSRYGLQPCTAANTCFRKVNQSGAQSNYPGYNADWAGEEVLDVEMVSAICPQCDITVVEANSPADADLTAAETTATQSGAKFISNSWGSLSGLAGPWNNHPGIVITASSGDDGYGVQYPAAYTNVVGVGGTSLLPAGNARGWDEITWVNGGSGCSAEPKPSWQTDTGCPGKSVVDVSAVADPSTGVMIYDSDPNGPTAGWGGVGGTSASSPIIAATYALGGDPGKNAGAAVMYAHSSWFNDITSGTNSADGCTPAYECNAGPGYDGPTGLGTPDNIYAWDCAPDIQNADLNPSTNSYTHEPAPRCQDDLIPGTGTVMSRVVVYLAFWLPPGTSFEGSTPDHNADLEYEAQQEHFIDDLDGSAYWNILSQYGVPDSVTLGGTTVDTRPLPPGMNGSALPDGAEAAEVSYVDNQQLWPADLAHVTLLFTPYGISDAKPVCGFHGIIPGTSGPYAWIPAAANGGCHLPPPSPGNATADTATGVMAHELAEAATDPLVNAWHAPNGDEVADACHGNPTGPWNDGSADVDLNGDVYLIQQLWSNAEHTCDMGMVAGGSPPPSVSQTQTSDNYNPAPGTTVHITLTLANKDPVGSATLVSLNERLPSNLSITDVSAPGNASSSYQGSSFSVSYAALAIEQSVTITITAVARSGSVSTACPKLTLDNLIGTSVAPASTQCVTL